MLDSWTLMTPVPSKSILTYFNRFLALLCWPSWFRCRAYHVSEDFNTKPNFKKKGHSRLNDKHFDWLMLLALYEANVEDIDYDDAIQEFMSVKGWRKFYFIAWIVNLSYCYYYIWQNGKTWFCRIHLHQWYTYVLRANVFGLLSHWLLFWKCYKTCSRPSSFSIISFTSNEQQCHVKLSHK